MLKHQQQHFGDFQAGRDGEILVSSAWSCPPAEIVGRDARGVVAFVERIIYSLQPRAIVDLPGYRLFLDADGERIVHTIVDIPRSVSSEVSPKKIFPVKSDTESYDDIYEATRLLIHPIQRKKRGISASSCHGKSASSCCPRLEESKWRVSCCTEADRRCVEDDGLIPLIHRSRRCLHPPTQVWSKLFRCCGS